MLARLVCCVLLALTLTACDNGDELFVTFQTARPRDFPASPIDDANLSRDRLAYSDPGADVSAVRVVSAVNPSDSLSEPSATGSSSVILHVIERRLFASYRDEQGPRPPVELDLPDRDGNADVDLDSCIAIPIRTGRYVDGDGEAVGAVRAREGAWVVVRTVQTLSTSATGRGPRRTLGVNVFLPALRNQPSANDPDFGLMEYGWQRRGALLPLLLDGAGEDVLGFAAVSDGLNGTALFESSAAAHDAASVAPVLGAPLANSLRFGDDMSRVGLLVFQYDGDDNGGAPADDRVALQLLSLNLADLSFEPAVEVRPGVGHFQPANTGVFEGATAYDPARVLVANQHAVLLLRDATRTGSTRFIVSTDVVAVALTVRDDGDGTCSLVTGVDTDLSPNGATGFHLAGSREAARLLPELRLLSSDEGLVGETLVFHVAADGRSDSGDPNFDEQLLATALVSAGTLEGTLRSAPQRVSTHLDTASSTVIDPVVEPRMLLTRDGAFALLLWRQAEISAAGPGPGLVGVAVSLDSSFGFPGARISPEQRLDGAPADATRQTTDAGGSPITLPVSDFRLPDRIGLRCGVQTDPDYLTVLYEQSSNFEDRVFARPLRITRTRPPIIRPGGELELETLNPVKTDFNATRGGDEVAFLEGDGRLANFRITDLGSDALNRAIQMMIVFSKESDDTVDTDGRGDRDILARLFSVDRATLRTTPGPRLELDDTDELEGAGRSERTDLVAISYGPVRQAADGPPDTLTVVFRQPRSESATEPLSLFVRTLDLAGLRASVVPDVIRLFEPELTEAPLRLDIGTGSVTPLMLSAGDRLNALPPRRRGGPAILSSAQRRLLFFLQDGRLYGSESTDGFLWSADKGRPAPPVIDHDNFGGTIDGPGSVTIAPFDDGACGNALGALILYRKAITTGSTERRLFLRTVRRDR